MNRVYSQSLAMILSLDRQEPYLHVMQPLIQFMILRGTPYTIVIDLKTIIIVIDLKPFR